MFVTFLCLQFDLMDKSLWDYIMNMAWPLAWSWMHMDFCIMNVLITDVVCGVLSRNNNPAMPGGNARDLELQPEGGLRSLSLEGGP